MGLDKDRETIKELQELVRQLQDILLVVANGFAVLQDDIKELKEGHIVLRRMSNHEPLAGLPSAE